MNLTALSPEQQIAELQRQVAKLEKANHLARQDQSTTAKRCAAQQHEIKHLHNAVKRSPDLTQARKARGDAVRERNEIRQALKRIVATVKTYNAVTNNGQDDDGRFQAAAWHDCVRIARDMLDRRRPKRAFVYLRNMPEEKAIWLSTEDSILGVTWMECPECSGTGVFKITDDDRQPCNYCKSRGFVLISC